jgi:hypothetical protein
MTTIENWKKCLLLRYRDKFDIRFKGHFAQSGTNVRILNSKYGKFDIGFPEKNAVFSNDNLSKKPPEIAIKTLTPGHTDQQSATVQKGRQDDVKVQNVERQKVEK